MTNAFYWLVTHIVRLFVMPIYMTVQCRGAENVPREGPLLIASNHLSDVDPGVLATRISRRLVFMTKSELFRIPLLKQFLRAYGALPVRRGEGDLSAIRRSGETLKAGLALVVFPEGTRAGERLDMVKAWPGAGLLALRTGAPILPCAITGSQDMGMPLLFLRVFRRRHVTLTIGKPFDLPPVARINTESSAAGVEVIMRRIAELLPKEYRGYYGVGGEGQDTP